jgi:hypothetical protein
MEGLALLITVIAGLALFDVAALVWGVDSRPGLRDDHAR